MFNGQCSMVNVLSAKPDFWKALPFEELWEGACSFGLGVVANIAHLKAQTFQVLEPKLFLVLERTSNELSERKKQMTYFFL